MRRGNERKKDSDVVPRSEKGKGIQTVETKKPLWRKRKIRRVTEIETRRIAQILYKSEIDDMRRGGITIWEGERYSGVKPGGCNW